MRNGREETLLLCLALVYPRVGTVLLYLQDRTILRKVYAFDKNSRTLYGISHLVSISESLTEKRHLTSSST